MEIARAHGLPLSSRNIIIITASTAIIVIMIIIINISYSCYPYENSECKNHVCIIIIVTTVTIVIVMCCFDYYYYIMIGINDHHCHDLYTVIIVAAVS